MVLFEPEGDADENGRLEPKPMGEVAPPFILMASDDVEAEENDVAAKGAVYGTIGC